LKFQELSETEADDFAVGNLRASGFDKTSAAHIRRKLINFVKAAVDEGATDSVAFVNNQK
jgi:hypothetical protein